MHKKISVKKFIGRKEIIVNIIVVDDSATEGAGASGAMILA